MFHHNTLRLVDIWRAQRRGEPLPTRSSLAPGEFGPLLPQIFILGRQEEGMTFRLIGGEAGDLFGRDLRGSAFLSLWPARDRAKVLEAMARGMMETTPLVLTADVETDQGDLGVIEIVLAPFLGPDGEPNRSLGMIQPVTPRARLMRRPIVKLSLRNAALAAERFSRSNLRLVALNGARVA